MSRIDVLNSGFVRLVDHMGDDLSIVRAARVSYNADWRSEIETVNLAPNQKPGALDGAKDAKLIRYLYANKHTSPFEAVVFTFEIKCPIFIARQWHRHRTWSYNEISARYVELDEGFYVPEPQHITEQAKDNKQARTSTQHPRSFEFQRRIHNLCASATSEYLLLLADGCPRELARSVLPVAAYTRFFGTVDLHNLFHFLRLRLHAHAQYEIRVYAEALLALIEPIVPTAVAAFKEAA